VTTAPTGGSPSDQVIQAASGKKRQHCSRHENRLSAGLRRDAQRCLALQRFKPEIPVFFTFYAHHGKRRVDELEDLVTKSPARNDFRQISSLPIVIVVPAKAGPAHGLKAHGAMIIY
jgi:hypothetical protein